MATKQVSDSAFPIRMFYAPTPDLIREAADNGYTHVFIQSFGHVRRNPDGASLESIGREQSLKDDFPIFFDRYPKLAKERRRIGEASILAYQNRIREKIALAESLGMKSLIGSYELSLPYELKRCYPEFFATTREFCLSDGKKQAFIKDKVAEFFETFPGLSGYMFTAKEASEGIYFNHACDSCAMLSVAERINMLVQAVVDGKNETAPNAEIIFRVWGMQFPKRFYTDRNRLMWEWYGKPEAYRDYGQKRNNSSLTYNPDEVLPEMAKLLDRSVIICSKATWQDYDLRSPFNPWIGRFPHHREMVEVSFENYLSLPLRRHYAMTTQIADYLCTSRTRNVEGILILPCPFGITEVLDEEKSDGTFVCVIGKGQCVPTMPDGNEPCLARVTGYIARKMLQAPDADVRMLVKQYVSEYHGAEEATFLADLIFSIEELSDRAIKANGVAFNGPNHYLNVFSMHLESYKEHSSWSCCMHDKFDNAVMDILRDPQPFFDIKDKAIIEAEDWLQQLNAHADSIPEKTFAFFKNAYTGFIDILRINVASQKVALTLWALEMGFRQPDERTIEFIGHHIRETEKIMLHSPIRDLMIKASLHDRKHGFGGIQRYERLTEE